MKGWWGWGGGGGVGVIELSRGVWGHASPEIFENLSLYNGHFQSI